MGNKPYLHLDPFSLLDCNQIKLVPLLRPVTLNLNSKFVLVLSRIWKAHVSQLWECEVLSGWHYIRPVVYLES